MDILVTGGAGYIGSYMCKMLDGAGHRPVVVDDLSRGHRKAVRWGEFFEGKIDDESLLAKIFSSFDIAAVMHFAGYIAVGESVANPGLYYANNVAAAVPLLEAMKAAGVMRFIFSSSAAVYGEPEKTPIPEDHPLRPVNPYGHSKAMVEQILDDYAAACGLRHVCLRYFNAAGADPDGELGENHLPESHLIPLVLEAAAGRRPAIQVFGDDYPTEDGTCVRDYVHIEDLAAAHLLALERLLSGGAGGRYNLGNGRGYSVREVIETARKVTGKDIPVEIAPRRSGDPAVLVASSDKAVAELDWRPRYADLETILDTAWRWHRRHPNGY